MDCDLSVSMHKMGNVTSSSSSHNAPREVLLQIYGFQRGTISDNAAHPVEHAPLYQKDVTALLAGKRNAANKGEVVLRPAVGTYIDATYITDVCHVNRMIVRIWSMAGVF